jgi:hypothetical protein
MPGPDEEKKAQEKLLNSPEAKEFMNFIIKNGAIAPPDPFKKNRQMLKDNIQCPVCGYYCVGKGGHGCINKPELCGL